MISGNYLTLDDSVSIYSGCPASKHRVDRRIKVRFPLWSCPARQRRSLLVNLPQYYRHCFRSQTHLVSGDSLIRFVSKSLMKHGLVMYACSKPG